MKHILSLFLFMSVLTSSNLFAQSFCATPNNIPDYLQTIPTNQKQQASFGHDVVRIYVHIMRRADGTGGQTYEEVDIALNFLYSDYDEHTICFDLVGWDEINDDVLYNGVAFGPLAPYMDPSRIDLFLFANDKLNSGQANGIPGDALRIGGNAFGSNLVTSHVISHEMGHCLGLYHTFHGLCEGGCAELVDGSNCTTCGDFVCDTPPDPQTFQVNQSTCLWNGSTCGVATTDANGDAYNPNTNFIMSYIAPSCMQVHTADQGTRMKDMIANSSILQAVVTTNEPTTLYMKDNPNDFGIEPNPVGWGAPNRFWISKDMWIRNVDDNVTVHENPEHTTINPIYVYVRVRNKGCEPSSGTEQLKAYWTVSNIGITDWPTSWDNYVAGSVLSGDVIGTQTIPVLNPGESTIVKLPWFAPDPADFGAVEQHVCLIARIETDAVAPFGMTFTEASSIWPNGNVDKNNKIIWKNITVVNNNPTDFTTGGIFIGNVTSVKTEYDVVFHVPLEDRARPFTDHGLVTVELGPELYDKWMKSGKKGDNVSENKFNHMSANGKLHNHSTKHLANAPSESSIVITGADATIKNLSLEPGEVGKLSVKFDFLAQPSPMKEDFTFDILGRNSETNEIVNGMYYNITAPECILADAGYDITIGKRCITTLTASPFIGGATYTWFNNSDGTLVGTGQSIDVSPTRDTEYEVQISSPNNCLVYDLVKVNLDQDNSIACGPDPTPPGCFDGIKTFPNPAMGGDDLHVNFMVKERANVHIKLVDMQGKVREKDNRVYMPGPVEHIVRLDRVPPGVYKLIVSCQSKVEERIITKMK